MDGPRTDVNDVTSYAYDAVGQLVQTTNGLGQVYSYDYDILGQLTSVALPGRAAMQFTLDGAGRRIGEAVGNGRSRSWSYWPDGRLHEATDFDGKVMRSRYDSAGRLVHLDHAPLSASSYSSDDVTYSYNSNGQVWQTTDYQVDTNGTTTDHFYDAAARLIRHNRVGTGYVHYGYDGVTMTELTSAFDGQAPTVRPHSYDKAGRIVSMAMTGWDVGTETVQLGYNALGMTSQSFPASTGVDSSLTRNLAGQLTDLTQGKNGGWSFNQQLLYTGGHVKDVIESGSQSLNGSQSFTLDGANRMTQANQGGNVSNYSYKDDGSLASMPGLALLSYDSSGWLTAAGFTQGDQGNLTTYPAQASGSINATYDSANRLKSTDNGITQVTYAYDADGTLVRKCAGPSGGSLSCVDRLNEYSGAFSKAIATREGSSLQNYLFGVHGELLAGDGSTGTAFYLTDRQNSVMAQFDTAGSWQGQRSYDAYGKMTQDTIGNLPFGYTGEWQNEDNTLYLRARHYAPHLGRFLQRDGYEGRIGDPGSLNRFGYAEGAPGTYSDPSGNAVASPVTNTLNKIVNKYGNLPPHCFGGGGGPLPGGGGGPLPGGGGGPLPGGGGGPLPGGGGGPLPGGGGGPFPGGGGGLLPGGGNGGGYTGPLGVLSGNGGILVAGNPFGNSGLGNGLLGGLAGGMGAGLQHMEDKFQRKLAGDDSGLTFIGLPNGGLIVGPKGYRGNGFTNTTTTTGGKTVINQFSTGSGHNTIRTNTGAAIHNQVHTGSGNNMSNGHNVHSVNQYHTGSGYNIDGQMRVNGKPVGSTAGSSPKYLNQSHSGSGDNIGWNSRVRLNIRGRNMMTIDQPNGSTPKALNQHHSGSGDNIGWHSEKNINYNGSVRK